jgi:hypothetical protein
MKLKDNKTASGKKTGSGSRRRIAPDWQRVVAISGAKAKREDREQAQEPVINPSALKPLKRLGVTPQQLAQQPDISAVMKLADGGIKQCLSAMRLFRGDEAISKFLGKYDTLSTYDKAHLPVEAICIAAGVDCVALLGAVTLALQAQAASMIRILATSSHIRILESRIKYGQLPFGERDRTALDTALGFLPSPKGPTFIGKAIFGSGQNVMDQQRGNGPEDEEDEAASMALDDIDLDKLFPPANRMQEKLAAIRQRLLPDDTKTRLN